MKPETQKCALRRLKIVEGQVRGIQKLVEDNKYCIDILTQSTAVKEAISGIENLILENHLKTHVVEQITSGKESKAIKEIMDVYRISKRK